MRWLMVSSIALVFFTTLVGCSDAFNKRWQSLFPVADVTASTVKVQWQAPPPGQSQLLIHRYHQNTTKQAIQNGETEWELDVPSWTTKGHQLLLQSPDVNEAVSANLLPSVVVKETYLKASNTHKSRFFGDVFGHSLALSADGKTLAVSAFGESSKSNQIDGDQSNNDMNGSGAIYTFRKQDGEWQPQTYIKSSVPQAEAGFGWHIDLSGDGKTLAVGANDMDTEGKINGGAVFVYQFEKDQWREVAMLTASDAQHGAGYGITVALNGDGSKLAVGSYKHRTDHQEVGKVYFYEKNNQAWLFSEALQAPNGNHRDWFGFSLDMSQDGKTLAVGAYGEASTLDAEQQLQPENNDAPDSGAVFVYAASPKGWQLQQQLKAAQSDAGDSFGSSVSLNADGSLLAVGAIGESALPKGANTDVSNNDASFAGAAYLFAKEASGWHQQAYLKPMQGQATEFFGNSVSLSGDGRSLAVGAFLESSQVTGNGAAFVFAKPFGEWQQMQYLKAKHVSKYKKFGASVAMNQTGDVMAIGAEGDASNAVNVNGDQSNRLAPASGGAFVYETPSSAM